ncbi:DUF3108 domain-containing protein, partial [Thermoproteota archaeon]
ETPDDKKVKEIKFYPERDIAEREGIFYKIPNKTYDPISVIFTLLDWEFVIGEEIILELLSKEEIYELRATPVEVKGEIYKLEGEVLRQDRSSLHGATFELWVRAGDIRVPLLIKVKTKAGLIHLRLVDLR